MSMILFGLTFNTSTLQQYKDSIFSTPNTQRGHVPTSSPALYLYSTSLLSSAHLEFQVHGPAVCLKQALNRVLVLFSQATGQLGQSRQNVALCCAVAAVILHAHQAVMYSSSQVRNFFVYFPKKHKKKTLLEGSASKERLGKTSSQARTMFIASQ